MPLGKAMKFIEAIPRLQAEESILAIRSVAVGTGSLEHGAARDVMRSLEHDLAPVSRPAARPQDADSYRRALEGMGITVVVEGSNG